MPFFAVTYSYSDDTAALDEVRPEHRAWLSERDSLRLSGPTDDGGALLIFEGESAAEVETTLDGDPFRQHGLVVERRVAAWNPVLGGWVGTLGLG